VRDASERDRAIALAGVFQSAYLVAQIARRGVADAQAMLASLGSVFVLDPESVDAVFGGAEHVAEGVRVMRQQLGSVVGPRDLEVTRYVIGLLHLERRLRRRADLLRQIREGIEGIQAPGGSLLPMDLAVVNRLAEVYVATVSTLGPRIVVRGEPGLLTRPDNANRIRALLLAGIRAAVLWRQCGGSRIGLLLGRHRLLDAALSLAPP